VVMAMKYPRRVRVTMGFSRRWINGFTLTHHPAQAPTS
jgi:hypothetical protein